MNISVILAYQIFIYGDCQSCFFMRISVSKANHNLADINVPLVVVIVGNPIQALLFLAFTKEFSGISTKHLNITTSSAGQVLHL